MAAIPPRILLIEDDYTTAMLIAETLSDHFKTDVCVHASTAGEARQVDPTSVDLVLSDMNLPDGTGLDLLSEILARRPDLPVVLVTGEGVLDSALAAIRKGAYDYVVKTGDYLFAIPVIVEKNLAIWRTKQQNKRLERQLTQMLEELRVKNQQLEDAVQKLETMAATDPLTGLKNRRAFNVSLEQNFAAAQRYGHDIACLMIDLDSFKAFNDTFGHQQGDRLIQTAGRVLKAACRRSDVAGRYGGDEFILLMPNTALPVAEHVAKRIVEEFGQATAPLYPDDADLRVTMSMGIATLQHSHPNNGEQLIAHADAALYAAKDAGKTQLCVFHRAPAA